MMLRKVYEYAQKSGLHNDDMDTNLFLSILCCSLNWDPVDVMFYVRSKTLFAEEYIPACT